MNRAVIIEVKAVDKLAPVFEAQLLTYLRLAGVSRDLVINFHVPLLKDGILRRILSRNRLSPTSPLLVSSASSSASSAPLR